MANDYFLPHQDMIDLVPQNLRNPMAKSLLDNLFNRFLTQDEAVPLFGYVGRKPTSPDDRTPKVPQLDVERDINALIPILSFKVGTDTYSFTAQDLVRKAQVLGISSDQSSWLYSQGNNYAPPIDFDKFTNFFNYYWTAQALPTTPDLAWNPTLAPEYYVIAQPKLTDADKPNARVATTSSVVLTGSGFYQQTWTVTCTAIDASFLYFSIQANGSLVGFLPGEQVQTFQIPVLGMVANPGPYPTITNPVTFSVTSAAEPLLTFNVVRDVILDNGGGPYAYESFAIGDAFTISAPFLTSTYSVTFTGGPGQKGKITQVDSLDTYQTIDGITLEEDDRVLVRHGAASDQGIYVVKPGAWVRAADFDTGTAAGGALVFVQQGSQANSLWTSFTSGTGYGWNLVASNTISNTNNWQEGNFWAKREDLVAIGADLSKVTQATRPIIEFAANLQLNSRVGSDGKPTDVGGTLYEQRKTEFNQAPLYDLYRYDGTHATKVTPIFFYVEDPTADIDPALQRRAKHSTNDSADFLFNHGLLDGENSLLFYKDKLGALHTIWHPGYSQATVVDQEYGGTGDGTLVVTPGTDAFSAQQIWTLTAITPTSFQVVGSKLKVLPSPLDVITVGTPYANGLFNATITAGAVPFVVGDTFRFRLANFETTRYVYRDDDQALYDLFGGPTLDTNSVGAWQVPRMFFNNVAADNGDEVPEGTLYSHFRGVLANQLSTTPTDDAFGGSIKLWSEQQNLLASLLMQRDMTPISMIDLAQRQYEAALNAVSDIYMTSILEYFSTVEVLSSPADTAELLDWILEIRAKDDDVRSVLYDSTSPVKGFPATLPQLGVTPLTEPGVVFDNELGAELFRHHDGHLSPLFFQTPEFRDRLLSSKLNMKRSDGSMTPAVGSYTTTAPSAPYKGLLWMYPTGTDNEFRVFDVVSDTSASPPAAGLEVGDYWYNRGANLLSVWDGSLWQVESNLQAPWITINIADLLNDLLMGVEQRLYNGISALHRTYFNDNDVQLALDGVLAQQMQRELSTWAAANGFDPMAPDYVSTNAFTWNYRSSPTGSFAPVSESAVPARWFNALQSHHLTFGAQVVPTPRPNLEPWKLLGNLTKPAGWDAAYAANVTPNMIDAGGYVVGATVDAVLFSDAAVVTPLSGLPLVDGVLLSAGKTILLTSEASPSNNGVWVVSSGAWVRASVPLAANTLFLVSSGAQFSGTIWALLNTVLTVNVDPVTIEQVRLWKSQMWLDIQAARPALRLSVDTNRDELLPPYVSPTLPWSVHALTVQLPPTPEDPYVFGEGSPVETVWSKSIEYRYSMARALFRHDPLSFLGNCWGFEWVEVDGILYDGYDMAVPGHQRFRLHGQTNVQHVRKVPFTVGMVAGPSNIALTITRDAYTSAREHAWTIRADDVVIGTVVEGVTASLSSGGYVISNLRIEDEGLPFRVGDKFVLSANADGSGLSVIFEAASYHQILGFGQTFTHALRAASIDTNRSYAIQAYRGWDVNLGYRAGGLVSTDDLRVFTDTAALPESAYTLRFKRSQYARDLWVQGLRVTVVQIGGSVFTSTGQSVPSSDASDWKFRVEGYNPRYLGIEYYDYNPTGEFVTFYALNGAHTAREWKQLSDVTSVISSQLPITITGLQNLTNFMFGYSRKLEDDGWRFTDENASNIDAETGRTRDWQLEIEKLIDRVYAGIELDQGHVVNPFIDRVWLAQETGLLSQYFDTALFDVTAHPAVFDTLGVKMNTADLTILRQRGSSMITANTPMFCVHAQVDEYEHLFVLNNLSSPSTNEGVIYDPFSGARISTLKLNGRRQGNGSLRPEFGGHYLVGDEVKRNLKASTDKVANYYNADTVFEDELSSRHALALLGFTPKEYMRDLDLNDRTQFNFWRGLIQMKGTNASISAFLNNDRFEDAKLDEYWAYKVAEYGDSRSKVFPELKLTVDDTLQQFTKLMFDQTPTGEYIAFTEIQSNDESRWFTLDDLSDDPVSFEAQVVGTFSKAVVLDEVVTLPFTADKLVFNAIATQVNTTTLKATAAGTLTVTGYGPATPKFNPVKLFNYVEAELVEEIPHWHPAVGQHAPVALESVNIISDKDPARYNVSTLVAGNSNFDPLRMWGTKEVGRIWWDTTNLDYLPYADTTIFPSVDERLSRWGTLADYATVDVVEWVESTVAPSEYDAQAAIDAGDADLNTRTRAEGTVYGAKTYSRERVWSARPIAWSRAGVAVEQAHPSFNTFGEIGDVVLTIDGSQAYIDRATFASMGITAGMRLGAWQVDPVYKPLSEYLINSVTKKIVPQTVTSSTPLAGSFTITPLGNSSAVGELLFVALPAIAEPVNDADGVQIATDWVTYVQVTAPTGENDVFLARRDRSITLSSSNDAVFSVVAGQTFLFELPNIGISLTFTASASAINVSTTALADTIGDTLGDAVVVYDAVNVSFVAGDASLTVLSNDVFNNPFVLNGWQAWSVPTQAALDADARIPNSQYFPYLGDMVPVTSRVSTVLEAAAGASFTLNNGVVVERYTTSWGEWTELASTITKTVALVAGSVEFTVPAGITVDRLSVYVNGVAQLTGTYTLVGTTVTVLNVPAGHQVTLIVRAYSPTAEELEFDPAVEDDLLIQRQYKTDYQYVEVPVRDRDGAVTTTKYYFWVKNRTSAAPKNNLSAKAVAQLLAEGPSQYLTFQNISTTAPYSYNALAIAGLNYVVTKDNAFKLRFTRNFTLRDDPNQLDLKDTHVEWSLIRPGQRVKIPEALWAKLVNTACGQDPAGNALPSPRRASYDERNGTRTRFGFSADQVLAPTDLVLSTLLFTVLNTKLLDESGAVPIPDYMTFLDFDQSDTWFSTPANTRNTLTRIWNEAKVSQINELFFAVLEDIIASNYELTDIFKTSRLSAYSIKVVRPGPIAPSYE